MVVDGDSPHYKMMGDDAEAGRVVWFWHLDGCNINDHFAFSRFLTEKSIWKIVCNGLMYASLIGNGRNVRNGSLGGDPSITIQVH